MNRVSRRVVVFNIAGHSQQYNHVKEGNFNGCGLHSPDNKEAADESQLCDDDVMLVLALIKAMCLMGFPRYLPCPASSDILN